ncbi:hypothetical protein ACROYT_G032205 [Oculina patagonica]
MKTFFNILLSLSVCSIKVVGSNEIYVSRYHGNSLPSCGKTILTACKTIALATTQAQWNDTIYIDGTGTSRDPYPCSSLTSHPEGIYVDKSLFFERFGKDEAVLRCLSTRQMIFDGRNVTEKVVIRFMGLTIVNSHVTVRKCSLYVENCHFKDAISFPNATAVLYFESFEDQLSLTIRKSTFRNNGYPCIHVLGSRPKIEVYDTAFINNTAIGTSTRYKWVDLGVFMVLLLTQKVQYPGAFVTLTNTSFIKNTAPLGGCLHVEGISAECEDRKVLRGQKDRRSTKYVSIFSQALNSTKHKGRKSSAKEYLSIRVSEGTFANNLGRAITMISVSDGNISIVRSDFLNNSSPIGGAILLYEFTELLLLIESSKFVRNSAPKTGSAIYVGDLASVQATSVFVRKVLFLGNVIAGNHSSHQYGGALTIDQANNLTVLLEDVSFMYNTATIGSSSLCSIGCFQNMTIVDSSFIGNSQDEQFSNQWSIAHIVSNHLSCSINRTVISGNYAKERVINPIVEGRPIHFIVISNGLGQIDINGLQYKNNTGSGIYIHVEKIYGGVNSTIISLQNSQFEDNEVFSFNIKAG